MDRIVHNEPANRYELFVDGELASIAEYRRSGDRLVFHHTETGHAFRGRGLAAQVVEFAMNDVRDKELTVVPRCWFVRQFLDDHPEYREVLAA